LFELVPEDEEMFEFVQDDMELFNQLDFIREDFSWKSSDKTQQKLKPWEASNPTSTWATTNIQTQVKFS